MKTVMAIIHGNSGMRVWYRGIDITDACISWEVTYDEHGSLFMSAILRDGNIEKVVTQDDEHELVIMREDGRELARNH